MATPNNPLITAMLQPDFYPHPVTSIERVETHISQVFLTGDFAYKIKKPVNFGFLDFTTLEKRKYYCEEELRLNRRLAPDIYLDVIAICESNGALHFGHHGVIIEYAIKMRQFDSHGLFEQLMDENKIHPHHIINLAERLAEFHRNIAICDPASDFGSPAAVSQPVMQNFSILQNLLQPEELAIAETVKQHSVELIKKLEPEFIKRKQQGHIRECHGDLHLGNIALSNNQIILFDGIEFNDSFRWIDTISDVAFLIMDCHDHQRSDFAYQLLNQYLAISGDYAGLSVLRCYMIYRAMVRAKVAALRLQQEPDHPSTSSPLQHQLDKYLQLASSFCKTDPPFLAITHGVSGSGKSHLAQQLAAHSGAIVIRSDQERKRLFTSHNSELYSQEITCQVYNHLLELSEQILKYGYSVIVDATFLDTIQRQTFRQLADRLSAPFRILHCYADVATLEQRIQRRAEDSNNISDADIKIMHQQLSVPHELTAAEKTDCIVINTAGAVNAKELAAMLKNH